MTDDTESEADGDDTAAGTAPDTATSTEDEPVRFSLPRCPRCNTPIAQTTMIGPGEAVAGPCGCRVAPSVGKRTDSK